MYKRSLIFTAVALAIACRCAPALANQLPTTNETTDQQHPASGINEVGDDELATMRGRYTVGDNTVVYFGVEMVSTWQTNTGQTLQSAMSLQMNFSKNPNQPQVTFVPTVTITTADAPLPVTPSTITRSVQTGGIANVGGLTQSVQLAGDHNAASNITSLNIQNIGATSSGSGSANAGAALNSSAYSGGNTGSIAPPDSSVAPVTGGVAPADDNATPSVSINTGNATANGRTATVGNATASSTYSNDAANVDLSVAGQGSVSQWIHAGSLGQTIALTTDNQVVTNQMIVSLVTQSVTSTTSQIAHNLAQSVNLSRTIGH
ncbi:MAG TPA: hypothetical protein VME63_07545 [Dyella sp.]|uniref:hypothetical protein n=1 Tax=Dyella sp. TaxID=1869338 RepID=UPI002B7A640A|nr:hypothetical protein [Dyella sp.]HTV85242.1 hypothetical protein [Dyella sp.]